MNSSLQLLNVGNSFSLFSVKVKSLNMGIHACKTALREVEAGESLPVWSQLELHSEFWDTMG